eukprot:scaffold79260_cov17-Tisochrysis_lutea.AAC.1
MNTFGCKRMNTASLPSSSMLAGRQSTPTPSALDGLHLAGVLVGSWCCHCNVASCPTGAVHDGRVQAA